jgi:hypothetical protein
MTIVVDPNPAIEGSPVTITVSGPGPYSWAVSPTGEWQTVPIDPETQRGQIVLPAGSGGHVLQISDLAIPNSDSAAVNIDSPS